MQTMTALRRTTALAAILAGSLLLQGCLVGAVVGTAGAVVGGAAKATGADASGAGGDRRPDFDQDGAGGRQRIERPDRQGVETSTLKLLIAILLNCPIDAEQHAVTGFWQTWNNPLYQLRLLDALLSLPGDTFNFVSLPGRRVVTIDDIPQSSPTIKQLAANVQGHTWNSLDLFEVLVRLASSEMVSATFCRT